MKRNDLRRAGTRSHSAVACAPPIWHRWLPSQPLPPPLPILPQPAVHSPGRPSARGGKWAQMDPKCAKVHFLHFWGPKCKKGAHFPFLEPKVRKGAHFRILSTKSVKSDAETIGFISICGQGAKRTQKCISGPKNAFWGPKCIFGPRNAFWAPKCSPAKREQNGTDFSAPL